MSAIIQYQYYEAVFDPIDLETLKPSAKQFIRETAIFEAMWVIEEGEPRAGQWVFGVPEHWWKTRKIDFHWIPEEDLKIIRMIDRFA